MDRNVKDKEATIKTERRKKQKRRSQDTTKDEAPLLPSSQELNIEKPDATIEESNAELQTKKIKKSKTSKRSGDTVLNSNKKNKLGNDNLGEIQKKTNCPKKKKLYNDDEAEVKDEDIDKFCEELDEEDNKQYENWVKLFEANFRPNKKKT